MKHGSDSYRTLILIFALTPIFIPFSSAKTYQAGFTSNLLDYEFQNLSLDNCVQLIAKTDCLTVRFAPSAEAFRKATVNFKLRNASPTRALNILLTLQKLKYEYIDYKTLIVFQGAMPESVKPTNVVWKDGSLNGFIKIIAEKEGFAVELLDDNAKQARFTTDIRDISPFRAFETVLQSQGLTYERVACSTIIIFRDQSLLLK
jgi:hypothetical protein